MEIDEEGNHDFQFVSYVYSKNKKAYDRMKIDYNFLGTPTVWFDGGDIVELGGYTGNKQDYIKTINTCSVRPVHELDLDLAVHWLGNATMEIVVSIKNIDALPSDYEGHLRVFVCEIGSSLGWNDTAGKPYPNAFLEYAFNESVTIAQGGTWQKSMTWDGHLYNTGYGVTYGNIARDNIKVVAAVFNDTVHQGYSYPPNQNPFAAYYVDEAEGAIPDTLWGDTDSVPEAGGTVNIDLSADGTNGGRNYLLFGSVSGSAPGTPLPGGRVTLPINWDAFTSLVISLANSSFFVNFMGTLDASGKSTASLVLPAIPGMAGITMTFAYALNAPWDFASNPMGIEIVP